MCSFHAAEYAGVSGENINRREGRGQRENSRRTEPDLRQGPLERAREPHIAQVMANTLAGNAGNAVNELSLPDLYSELSKTGALRDAWIKCRAGNNHRAGAHVWAMTCFGCAGLVTRLLELARDEDLGIGGQPGDLTCKVTLGKRAPCPLPALGMGPCVVLTIYICRMYRINRAPSCDDSSV